MAYYKTSTRPAAQTAAPAAKAAHVPTWTDISGRMTVFGNQHETRAGVPFTTYAASVGRRNDDGTYSNLKYDVIFPRDAHPDIVGRFDINIKRAFLTLREFPTSDGDGRARTPAVMVLEYDMV